MKCVNPRCQCPAGPSLLCEEHDRNAQHILATIATKRARVLTQGQLRSQRRRERLWSLGLTSHGTPRR